MDPTKLNIELFSLGNILDGFNTQSISMPSICQRFLELEGSFTDDEIMQSLDIYKDIMNLKISGIHITIAMLSIYYVLAELTLKRKEHQTNTNTEIQKVETQGLQGYV